MKMLRFEENLTQRLGQLPPHLMMDQSGGLFMKDSNNNSATQLSDNNSLDKYSLRPRSMRRRTTAINLSETIQQIPDSAVVPAKAIRLTEGKPKQKAAPLSKYRRKTANARERTRMREINQAFEELRKAVPSELNSVPLPIATNAANEKLTKITTLRLAMKYISSLSAVLTDPSSISSTSSSSCSVPISELLSECSDLDSLLLESDGESLPLNSSDFSDHSLTPADFTMDFPDDTSSSLAGMDFTPLSPDLSHHLTQFDPFLSDFS